MEPDFTAVTAFAIFDDLTRVVLLGVGLAAAVVAGVFRIARRPTVVAPAALVAFLVLGLAAAERLLSLVALGATPGEFNEWRWVLGAPWGRTGMLLGGGLALATLVLSWRGTRREPSPWRRAFLAALRAGACAAALILFLEPALELRHVQREPNHVAVLIDDSRSMGLAETKGGTTRAERARRLLEASAATFERWRALHHVDFFTFSEGVVATTAAALGRAVEPRADATLLREALEDLRQRYEKDDLAGVVLLSDGVPTGRFSDGVGDGASQDFLSGLGTRVHTAWMGRGGLKDLAVARIDADEFAFVRTVVKVEAVVRASGFARRPVTVTLSRAGVEIGRKTVPLGDGEAETRVVFEFTPDRIGKYVYEIGVPVDDEEVVTTNNARAFVLRVIREKVRVLQVAGRPSWDERALRGQLEADPNVDLISFFILRTPEDIQDVPPEEMSLIPFPTEELFVEELGSFDVVILMNFEYGPYRIGPYLENIKRYVLDGGALAMVGGDLSFSSGDYFQTPVADVLPVELLPNDPVPGRLISQEEFHPRLTLEGLRHPIPRLRFERRDNEARWNSLPALEGLNLVAGAKPDATVLAVHPFLKARSGQPMPVLVAGEVGKGRTLALLSDSAWRWGFVAAGRDGDDGRSYQKFWENSLRWLMRDPELEYLHVAADQAEYGPGDGARVTARLVDKDYRPARGADVTLEVSRIELQQQGALSPVLGRKLRTDDEGEAALELKPPAPGAYRVTGQARVGERMVTAEDVFLVSGEHAELEHPGAREDVLSGIAAATGGDYLGPVETLPAGLAFAPPRIVRVDRKVDVELWSRPYLLVVALVFLGLEWSLRRKRGYL